MDVRKKLAEIVKKAAYSSLPSNTEDFHLNMFVTNLLSHGVTVQEWIPVTERLPEKGEDVLVFNIRENWTGFAWLRPDETWTALGFDFPFDLGEVTHWMPLPQPPKGE